jgi:Histidine phosphatase superfamily (branch 1)
VLLCSLNVLTVRKMGLYKDDVVCNVHFCLIVDVCLNDVGILQSRLVGQALESVPFTQIYSSPQMRAIQVLSLDIMILSLDLS